MFPLFCSALRPYKWHATMLICHSGGTGRVAAGPAQIAISDAGALAAVVASASSLAASDCRNFEAVITNLNTSFIGPQRSAVVGPVSVAYRRFGPLRSSEKLQRPLVGNLALKRFAASTFHELYGRIALR